MEHSYNYSKNNTAIIITDYIDISVLTIISQPVVRLTLADHSGFSPAIS